MRVTFGNILGEITNYKSMFILKGISIQNGCRIVDRIDISTFLSEYDDLPVNVLKLFSHVVYSSKRVLNFNSSIVTFQISGNCED
jgi:hypothetical protein